VSGVLYEVADGIATLTINDPENRNALSAPVRAGLWDGFRSFRDDPAARVLILTGAGEKAFTAGGDLKAMTESMARDLPKDHLPIPGRNIEVAKPIIAAVNGFAVGGGMLYTIVADLAVASDNAKFSMPETRISRGAPWSVPLLHEMPRKIWLELAVTGAGMTAQRAAEVGLVNRVVPLAELMSTARELATTILEAAPLAVAATLAMVRSAADNGPAWDRADELFVPVYRSDDAVEGPRAWLEKRPPKWTGR
jgi:enoyl-CoA hydratase/carnithine racemase